LRFGRWSEIPFRDALLSSANFRLFAPEGALQEDNMTGLSLSSKIVSRLLLLSLSTMVLPAQDSNTGPGATDPAGNAKNFTLFRDEQIYSVGLPSAANQPLRSATISFDADVKPTSSVSDLTIWGTEAASEINIQTAVGRIVHPDKDDILLVRRLPGTSTLSARFADNSGATNIANAMLDRQGGYTDFFTVSAGELDNLYDADGNFHDEAVVAWTQAESAVCGQTVVPYLGVLNYNGKDPSNPTLTQVRVNQAGAFYNTCNLDGYNFRIRSGATSTPTDIPQPNDNIVATAIGDFDGDGKNEIALAYMRSIKSFAGITVVIYRYMNDGRTASLTPVNTYDLSIPNDAVPQSSMVATISLAAGNFDGSGADQLVVGTAAWWGTAGSNGEYTRGTFKSKPVAFLLAAGQTLGSITGAASSGASTNFTVDLGSGQYVPRTVSITGATGLWASINGTWAVTPSATGFNLNIDSSTFGGFAGQTVSVTTAAPLRQADFVTFEPIPGTTSGGIEIDDTDIDAFIRVQVLPGLFHYDPANGFDYRQRQIAMAWNSRAAVRYPALMQAGDVNLALLQITGDDKFQVAAQKGFFLGNWQMFQTLTMTAGALRGNNDTKDPTWSLYLSGMGALFDPNQPSGSRNLYRGMVNASFTVSPVDGDPSKLDTNFVCGGKATSDTYQPATMGALYPICQVWGATPTALRPDSTNQNYMRLASVAADLKGQSLRLGAPIHLELTNPGKAHFILEQPPQHSAYLELDATGPQVVTINRYPSFNTAMKDSTNTSFASQTKNHSDWNVGASEKISASNTLTGGSIEGTGAQTKYNFTEKVNYDYSKVHTDYSSWADSYQVGTGATTGIDDGLIVESQIYDIWRYRIFGAQTGDTKNPNAFYEIVLPGPSMQSNPGGKDAEWYQPIHEVGNILSYPARANVCTPSDLGPITIPNTDISNKAIPLIGCSQQFYNGNASVISLKLDNQTGSGQGDDYTHTVQADADFKLTFTASEGIKDVETAAASISADIDVHGGSSWGQLKTSDNSTTGATSITINSPQGDSNHAYPYYPILYNTTAGGLKVAYAVGDLTASASGSNFWVDNYGQKPDPALSLPNRFTPTYFGSGVVNGWQPITTILRKQMKGFVVRKSTTNPVTGGYDLVGSNAKDGDTVMLEARVYNYSLYTPNDRPTSTGPIAVQFSVIPYDSSTDREICTGIANTGKGRVCPASARTIIGQGSSAPTGGQPTITLNARESKLMYLMWNTKSFGPQTGGAKDYRVYVNLIYSSTPGELYPPEPPCTELPCEDDFGNQKIVDPGQNNEGWGLISIAAPTSPASLVPTTPANINRLSLKAETHLAGAPQGSPIIAYLGRSLSVKVEAAGNAAHPLHSHVAIFDGKPGTPGSKTIAAKIVRGVRSESAHTWHEWTPTAIGPHHLYSRVNEPGKHQAASDLLVEVV
jgi:hypothetical protein